MIDLDAGEFMFSDHGSSYNSFTISVLLYHTCLENT